MASRSVVGLCSAALLAVSLAGCGQETGNTDDAEAETTTTTSAPASLEGRWLLRVTAVSPEHEGEAQIAHYVWVTPSTGEVEDYSGDTFPESATGREATLLVDAGHEWGLTASLPGYAQGAPELVHLTDGTRTPFPATVPDLAAWSFDPTEPGQLRVVADSGKISLVDLASGEATTEGELVKTADEYGYGFDADTGEAYVVSLSGGPNRPAGLGDPVGKALAHADGQLVFDDTTLPAGPCPLSSGFEDADGAATAFCVSGKRLSVFTRAGADAAYEKFGEPILLGFSASGIDFALPPAG
jgi:hypothetical protein